MSEGNTRQQQRTQLGTKAGFVAALDQSGGSSPRVLRTYGIPDSEYSGTDEMFAKMHEMRCRLMTSESFSGSRILAAILFEDTLGREVEGVPAPDYLWSKKGVVPILKVDKGLMDESDGVQLMKPMPGLDELLARASKAGIFGTKMRSVIKLANPAGIKAIVDQQFEVGQQIIDAGLVPILEPEVDIHSPSKAEAEALLKTELMSHLDKLADGHEVMLKLTLPETDGFYTGCVNHKAVLRVVALSGGYSREEANQRLARNEGVIASFSRALTEGLTHGQTAEEFNGTLETSIQSIFEASQT
ncbi:MAG: fructose bisphosphate aldolase [Myxococcales bacterium]|nr:fructose bisphosphate aldolase [Myxococcales bacterium]